MMRLKIIIPLLLAGLGITSAFAEEEDHVAERQEVLADTILTDAQADSIIALAKAERAAQNPLIPQPGDSINTHANPYYNWKRDLTFAGVPLFISSFIIKEKKTGFRSARFSFEKGFKSEVDNYTQYSPYAAVVGLKLAGYKGRSNWGRFLVSAAFSNVAMATMVNSIKYSVKEMRPDNSTRNSFPSGHTATAFTAATVLHKEYGLTRSPWFSIGGYAVATATGVMRVLNNRHWISDVMAGAGIGIMSTELGYFAADLIFRDKGINRYELSDSDPDNPSFFDIQMGVGLHSKQIDFTYDNPAYPDDYIRLGTSTAFGIETAHFFNKYIGVGLMGRVTSTPAKGLNLSEEETAKIGRLNTILGDFSDREGRMLPGIYSITIDNGNFNNASLDAGVYLNMPLGKYFSVGAKALVGGRFGDGICYKARNGSPKIDDTYTITGKDGKVYPIYWFEDVDGSQFRSSELLDPGISRDYNFVLENPTAEYDFLTVNGKSAFNYILGLSFTWRYKSHFAWKVFADFDNAKNSYTYTSRFLSDEALSRIEQSAFPARYPEAWEEIKKPIHGHATKTLALFTFGGSFSVNF